MCHSALRQRAAATGPYQRSQAARRATEQVVEALAGRVPPYAVNAADLGLTG